MLLKHSRWTPNMQPLKKPVSLSTAFADYSVTHIIGEGGAGRVYRATTADGDAPVAIKLLTNSTSDKRKRFKNETGFLFRTRHPNLVEVIDHGMATGELVGPFYVMPLYEGSLRDLMKRGVSPDDAMRAFSKILDGVEAAHLLGVTHRDLKPENVLYGSGGTQFFIADFGIASFTKEMAVTLVETKPTTRLANFTYAAPEQRVAGRAVSESADIWALGLMLNELFTGEVPHGNSHKTIASVAPSFAFLDPLVAQMTTQAGAGRPNSIAEVKSHIEKYRADFIGQQRLDALRREVVPVGEVTQPMALRAPEITGVQWNSGVLQISLDTEIDPEWAQVLKFHLGSYTSVMGAGPESFNFRGNTASVSVPEHSAQDVINHFKNWLPRATTRYRQLIEQQIELNRQRREKELRGQREAEERRLAVNSRLTF